MAKRTLALLSGGADSLYCLLRQLRETDDEIFTFSHRLRNNRPLSNEAHVDNKLEAERYHRLYHVLPWLRKHERPFTELGFAEIDFSQMSQERFFVNRTRTTLYVAAMIGHTYGIGRIVSGHYFGTGFPLHHQKECHDILRAGYMNNPPPDFEWITPRAHISKSEVYKYLGDLADMTMSCNAPRKTTAGDWLMCGKCVQCQEILANRKTLPDIRRMIKHAA